MRTVKRYFKIALSIISIILISAIVLYFISRLVFGDSLAAVPYVGQIAGLAATETGLYVIIAIFVIILGNYISVIVADILHNTSRHRKRIVRKKQRRRERYMKEGLFDGNERIIPL